MRRAFLQGINHSSHIRSSQQGAVETLQTTHGWSDRSTQHQNANLKPISADSKLQIPGEIAADGVLGGGGGWVWDAAQIENESMQPGREKKLSLEGKLLYFKGASEIEVSEDVLWNQRKQFNEKEKIQNFSLFIPCAKPGHWALSSVPCNCFILLSSKLPGSLRIRLQYHRKWWGSVES